MENIVHIIDDIQMPNSSPGLNFSLVSFVTFWVVFELKLSVTFVKIIELFEVLFDVIFDVLLDVILDVVLDVILAVVLVEAD